LSQIPQEAVNAVIEMLKAKNVVVLPAGDRKTKLGDFKFDTSGMPHRITLNNSLNPYASCITLVHEIAHLYAFERYGKKIKPHGREWKESFRHLMYKLPLERVFPADVLEILIRHMSNPKASTSADLKLTAVLRKYDDSDPYVHVEDLKEEVLFTLDHRRWFKKGEKRRSRYLCYDIQKKKHYLVHALAQVLEYRST
jgi:SprT protein